MGFRGFRQSEKSRCIIYKTNMNQNLQFLLPAPVAQVVECPLRGTVGHGFDPGPRYTKVVKNSTICSSLGTQTYGVELGLVDPVSGSDWVWYPVKCLGHDTSVGQHYKSED